MTETLFALLTTIAFAVAISVGIVAWARLAYYMYKTTTELKPDVSWSDVRFGFNRFNVLFQPRFLSERWLEYRRKARQQLLWFLVPVLLVFVFGSLAGIVRGDERWQLSTKGHRRLGAGRV